MNYTLSDIIWNNKMKYCSLWPNFLLFFSWSEQNWHISAEFTIIISVQNGENFCSKDLTWEEHWDHQFPLLPGVQCMSTFSNFSESQNSNFHCYSQISQIQHIKIKKTFRFKQAQYWCSISWAILFNFFYTALRVKTLKL